MQYDVVIVGAGPGGLNCAEKLSEFGKSVLVLEKNAEIGPKVCAGGITNQDIRYLKLPLDLLDKKFNKVYLHSKLQSVEVALDYNFFYTVDRKKLGQWQLSKLKDKKNVTVRVNAEVTDINKNSVVINNKEKIGYKYLVGADGTNSIVRKYLGLPLEKIGLCIQYILPTEDFKEVEVFLNNRYFGPWYAWIFPHKDCVIVGTGCDPKYLSINKLKKNFDSWLKKKKIDVSKAKFEACPIPVDYRGHHFGNVFLIGDSAGFTSAWTGKGIYPALISGEEVAKIINDSRHSSNVIAGILKKNKTHIKMLNLFKKSWVFRQTVFEFFVLIVRSHKIMRWFIRTMH